MCLNLMNGGRICQFDYDAFVRILVSLENEILKDNVIDVPKIGAGLAKGDWSQILFYIKKYLNNHNVVIVDYDNSKVKLGN